MRPVTTPSPLTAARRQELLREFFHLHDERFQLQLDRATEHSNRVQQTLALQRALIDEYRAGLPLLPLGRCPFCDKIMRHSLDAMDLTGLWWDFERPVRAVTEDLCPHYLALAGAVSIDRERVASVPMLVVPGPEAPYVVPRLLAGRPVRAVVSSVRIGPHVGYPIFYFADPVPQDLRRVNTWGTGDYHYTTADGRSAWDRDRDTEADYDFDIAGWLGRGQLLWIAPDDPACELHGEAAGCPYVGLAGRREVLKVQDGKVWGDASEILDEALMG
jgi:hypothetical protein